MKFQRSAPVIRSRAALLAACTLIGSLGMTGCSDEELSRGTVGAVGGAIVGGILGNRSSAAAGAVIGGFLGAGTAQSRGRDYHHYNRTVPSSYYRYRY